MSQAMTDLGLTLEPITVEYADVQSRLPRHHGDPFDRLLIAQALTGTIPIVSSNPSFDPYGVTRLW
jgi:PIN domain nuclease of toxin-antitoxin system